MGGRLDVAVNPSVTFQRQRSRMEIDTGYRSPARPPASSTDTMGAIPPNSEQVGGHQCLLLYS